MTQDFYRINSLPSYFARSCIKSYSLPRAVSEPREASLQSRLFASQTT